MPRLSRSVGGDGPHRVHGGRDKRYRGSKKRVQRLRWYEDATIEFWFFVVVVLLMIVFGIPWLIRHPPDVHERMTHSSRTVSRLQLPIATR